jgi:hypothetical protein
MSHARISRQDRGPTHPAPPHLSRRTQRRRLHRRRGRDATISHVVPIEHPGRLGREMMPLTRGQEMTPE